MQDRRSALQAFRSQEAVDLDRASDLRRLEPAGRITQGAQRQFHFYPPRAAGFDHIGRMLQYRLADRNPGRGVAQRLAFENLAGDDEPVGRPFSVLSCFLDRLQAAASTGAAAGADSVPIRDFDFSSFIIGDGVVTACFIFMVR